LEALELVNASISNQNKNIDMDVWKYTLYSSFYKAKNGISNSNFFTKLGGWVDGTKVTVKNRVPR